MMADGGLGVMHPATALMSVSLVGEMVSVIMSSAGLTAHFSTHDSSALGDCPVAGTKVSCCTTITPSSVNTARYDFVACNNSVPAEVVDIVGLGRHVDRSLLQSLPALGTCQV